MSKLSAVVLTQDLTKLFMDFNPISIKTPILFRVTERHKTFNLAKQNKKPIYIKIIYINIYLYVYHLHNML